MAVPAPDLAGLRLLGDRVRPLTTAGERTLPVPGAFADLLPQRGLQRGSLVATGGVAATSLALALAGPVTATGSWLAVVGLEHMGLVAAAELGVNLERVLLVAEPEPRAWAATVAAVLDAVEIVLVRPPQPVGSTVQRRLSARARDRGSVLLQVGGRVEVWSEAPDLVMSASSSRWSGLEVGHGHLRARRLAVQVTGRRGAHQPRQAEVWLPDSKGAITLVEATPAITGAAPGGSPASADPSLRSRSGPGVLREVG